MCILRVTGHEWPWSDTFLTKRHLKICCSCFVQNIIIIFCRHEQKLDYCLQFCVTLVKCINYGKVPSGHQVTCITPQQIFHSSIKHLKCPHENQGNSSKAVSVFQRKLYHDCSSARWRESSFVLTGLLISPQVETITDGVSLSGPEKIHSLLHWPKASWCLINTHELTIYMERCRAFKEVVYSIFWK